MHQKMGAFQNGKAPIFILENKAYRALRNAQNKHIQPTQPALHISKQWETPWLRVEKEQSQSRFTSRFVEQIQSAANHRRNKIIIIIATSTSRTRTRTSNATTAKLIIIENMRYKT